ncbi:TetR/AcrR family transcriptional regulator [Nocardioides sp. GXQ0305]|uniref:TetR/AcrR family transcriptional regulator n=1 Tax=Nocardioides sp. GXQ0305 TaxID=3423912 RepID=UPI003D7F1371
MTPDVKTPVAPSTRAERTEQRIVAAARELFVAHGYRGTTLTDVARAAGVAERTIYVRFATKAELLKRVVDVAVVGDTQRIPLADRDWVEVVMNAPTLDERLAAEAAGAAELMDRIAPVLAVAIQAEGEEPLIADAAQAAREDTLRQGRAFWEKLAADGLLDPAVDLQWVIPTCALLANAETYVHMTRTLRWTGEEYRQWRYRTWWHVATVPCATPPS